MSAWSPLWGGGVPSRGRLATLRLLDEPGSPNLELLLARSLARSHEPAADRARTVCSLPSSSMLLQACVSLFLGRADELHPLSLSVSLLPPRRRT